MSKDKKERDKGFYRISDVNSPVQSAGVLSTCTTRVGSIISGNSSFGLTRSLQSQADQIIYNPQIKYWQLASAYIDKLEEAREDHWDCCSVALFLLCQSVVTLFGATVEQEDPSNRSVPQWDQFIFDAFKSHGWDLEKDN